MLKFKYKYNFNRNFMVNKNILILGAIILAILGVIAYSWSQKGDNPVPSISPVVFASPTALPNPTFTPTPTPQLSTTPTPSVDVSGWKTYRNDKYGISFRYPSAWVLGKDSSADQNFFGISFAIENINTELSVVGVTNSYINEGPPGWFGYCAVANKNVDQFCEKGCTRINDKTATRRGIENHGDKTYSLLAYTNISKKFPSICWELDMSPILFKVADQKGISYYEVKNEDVEDYIKGNDIDKDLKDIMQKFEELSQSIKSF